MSKYDKDLVWEFEVNEDGSARIIKYYHSEHLFDGTYYLITNKDGSHGYKINIPEKVVDKDGKEYEVKSIAEHAFGKVPELEVKSTSGGLFPDHLPSTEPNSQDIYLEQIAEVSIPKSVETIENDAFADLIKLRKVKIETPSCLKKIGARMCYNCHNLEVITIPETVEIIGAEAFAHCELLKEVTIPASVEKIGFRSFGRCQKLTKLTISNKKQLEMLKKTVQRILLKDVIFI